MTAGTPASLLARAVSYHLGASRLLVSKPFDAEFQRRHDDMTMLLFRALDRDKGPLGSSCARLMRKSRSLFVKLAREAGDTDASTQQQSLEKGLLTDIAEADAEGVRSRLSLEVFGLRTRREYHQALPAWELRRRPDWNADVIVDGSIQLPEIVAALCETSETTLAELPSLEHLDVKAASGAMPLVGTSSVTDAPNRVVRLKRRGSSRTGSFIVVDGPWFSEGAWEQSDHRVELRVVSQEGEVERGFVRYGVVLTIVDPTACALCQTPCSPDANDAASMCSRCRWLQRAEPCMGLGDQELADLDRGGYFDEIEPWDCEECFESTVYPTDDRKVAVCTNRVCREVFRLAPCPRCGESMLVGHEDKLCAVCESEFQRYMAKD